MKIKVTPKAFKDIKIGESFICLSTWKANPIIFTKTEDIPPIKKWSILSNASRLITNHKTGKIDTIGVHFMDKVICVLTSEFENQGIKIG